MLAVLLTFLLLKIFATVFQEFLPGTIDLSRGGGVTDKLLCPTGCCDREHMFAVLKCNRYYVYRHNYYWYYRLKVAVLKVLLALGL